MSWVKAPSWSSLALGLPGTFALLGGSSEDEEAGPSTAPLTGTRSWPFLAAPRLALALARVAESRRLQGLAGVAFRSSDAPAEGPWPWPGKLRRTAA